MDSIEDAPNGDRGGTPVPLGGLGEKQMQTFRMPRGLVAFLRDEAGREGRDLTAQVVRWLLGIRGYFGLPEAATALLESDRRRLGMERYEYLLHVLYQRSLRLREAGPGFDAPHGDPSARLAGQ
jgi:hypothetical protein